MGRRCVLPSLGDGRTVAWFLAGGGTCPSPRGPSLETTQAASGATAAAQ